MADDDIFVYMGGEQHVPRDVKRAKIDESIDTVPYRAFRDCRRLTEVEGHNKLKKIEAEASYGCPYLRRITKMGGVVEIETWAFGCTDLSEVEFDKLEIIGRYAFDYCHSLRSINLPSIKRIGEYAFYNCETLTEAVFGEDLEHIEGNAFYRCTALRRIAIPLKHNMISNDAFNRCENLSGVDIIGGIHKTISSLHMESWRNETQEEIDRINQTLPEIPASEKTVTIQHWIRSVIDRMEHYKTEHQIVVKEAMTLLELVLWKAKLLEEEGGKCEAEKGKRTKKAKIDIESARKEHRVTCGANIVIKNVLPFLALN